MSEIVAEWQGELAHIAPAGLYRMLPIVRKAVSDLSKYSCLTREIGFSGVVFNRGEGTLEERLNQHVQSNVNSVLTMIERTLMRMVISGDGTKDYGFYKESDGIESLVGNVVSGDLAASKACDVAREIVQSFHCDDDAVEWVVVAAPEVARSDSDLFVADEQIPVGESGRSSVYLLPLRTGWEPCTYLECALANGAIAPISWMVERDKWDYAMSATVRFRLVIERPEWAYRIEVMLEEQQGGR